ncbi:uncharacterized protein LOC143425047 [Xylocopa sonorina]|uniref:uncharacterized protein LOC143425047 n=1 Tax=Xylocopa sonorina TaxID=1818115 RepID=UPI00403A8BC2
MKTDICDPWCATNTTEISDDKCRNCFEDSFVDLSNHTKLADSEEYLTKLYSRLKNLQKGTSKKDLVSSLSVAKEDSIARLITSECKFETEEEIELASNPLIRHIVPHLQALTATELVHLLKADVLQLINESEQQEEQVDIETLTSKETIP